MTSAHSVALGSALREKYSHEDGEQVVEALAARYGTRDTRRGERVMREGVAAYAGLGKPAGKDGKGQ